MAKKVMDCNILVIGAGGQGLPAATKAEDLGVKNVIVLEQEVGG